MHLVELFLDQDSSISARSELHVNQLPVSHSDDITLERKQKGLFTQYVHKYTPGINIPHFMHCSLL